MHEQLSAGQAGTLPDLLGVVWTHAEAGRVEGRFTIEKRHMAPNGFLHAASVIALLDTACGYGAMLSRPEGATGFTTIELKSNFLGTAREGEVAGTARLAHGGRTTQVWDAEATAGGRTIALFRCTQMLLYPKA
jgi:uncharacterized protein (TIGR00369 family)